MFSDHLKFEFMELLRERWAREVGDGLSDDFKLDGRPWCRRGRRSMEDTKKKMKCSGNEDKSKKISRQWRFLVKMKSRSGVVVWKVARGDEGEG